MDDDTLERLAHALGKVSEEGKAMPMGALVEMAELELGGRVTVDFRAVGALGHPLVVFAPERPAPLWWEAHTAREREVATLVADGLSNAAIAERLGITLATTKDHVHKVLVKSGLRRRSQVAAALADV